MELTDIKNLIRKSNDMILTYTERQNNYDIIKNQADDIEKEMKELAEMLNKYQKACQIVSQLSDNNVNAMLSDIKKIINRALGVIFKDNTRTIDIIPELYKNQYPHFNVKLYTANGTERSFRQNGAGLAQIVSFLAEICMIDAKGCRKLLIMDEILNGVHPEALECIYAIMESVLDRFQFICVEYGFDIGKQILVENYNDTATLTELSEPYYANCYRELTGKVNS